MKFWAEHIIAQGKKTVAEILYNNKVMPFEI